MRESVPFSPNSWRGISSTTHGLVSGRGTAGSARATSREPMLPGADALDLPVEAAALPDDATGSDAPEEHDAHNTSAAPVAASKPGHLDTFNCMGLSRWFKKVRGAGPAVLDTVRGDYRPAPRWKYRRLPAVGDDAGMRGVRNWPGHPACSGGRSGWYAPPAPARSGSSVHARR